MHRRLSPGGASRRCHGRMILAAESAIARFAMMDDIADLTLRYGDRRARAYERAEPVVRCIEAAIRTYRRDRALVDGRPTIAELIAACTACGLTAARGGSVTRYTIRRALKLMGLP